MSGNKASRNTATGSRGTRARWTTRSRGCLLAYAVAMAASACATTGTRPASDVRAMPPSQPPPSIAAALLAPCEPMPLAPDARYETLLRIHDAEMEVHHRCADRQGALAKAATELQDTAWRWYCAALEAGGYRDTECTHRK